MEASTFLPGNGKITPKDNATRIRANNCIVQRNMSDKQMYLFLNFFVTLKALRNCKYYAPMQQIMCFVE